MKIFTNKMSNLISSAVFILALGMGTTASATLALSNSTAVGNQGWGGSLGTFFDVDAPFVRVSALGVYDSGQNGIVSGPLYAQIWKGDGSGAMTGVVTFTSGDPGTLVGNYLFKSISSVVLPTGKYLINAWGFSASDPNGNLNLANPPSITGNSGGGLVSYNPADLAPYSATGGTFPTTLTAVTSNFQFAAGNFRFAVPEPETYLLTASLLGAAMLMTWRKRHSRA